jgi:multisubunit Na+/H+ antiporter MnhB subunit
MNWIPLRILSGPVLWLLVGTSAVVLVRGHNEPGGGFIGGLLAASGLLVFALGQGPAQARRLLRWDPVVYLGVGILAAIASGIFGLFHGQPFLTGQLWGAVPGLGKVGTVLVFDTGIYLVVFGTVSEIMLRLLDVVGVEDKS